MLPNGFTKIPSYEVFINGDDLIILGDPPENEDEEAGHNCDVMGCGWDHVIARCKVVSLGIALPETPCGLTLNTGDSAEAGRTTGTADDPPSA